jgi:hypothetical protein
MKTLDIVHQFNDRRTNVSRGLCRVRSFVGPAGTVVLLTDLGDKNDGQSVTNAVELIIESLVEQGYVIPPAIFLDYEEHSFFIADRLHTCWLSAELGPHDQRISGTT